MSMNLIWTANPSRSLPTYGRAFGMPAGTQVATRMCVSVPSTVVVREHTAVRTQDLTAPAISKGAFEGTSAWRPPIC